MLVSWLLLAAAVLGLIHVLIAWNPSKGRWTMVYAFFASWLTIELAFHHVAVGIVVAASLVWFGALDHTVGWVGLALMSFAIVGMLATGLRSLRTKVIVTGALTDLDPGPDAPRFPRSHIVFPFLMGRRRGVTMRKNITFRKVAGKKLRLDVTLPPGWAPTDRRPALVQIHGGAWIIGDKREQGLPLLSHMAVNGWVGFNVNYRLSPGATWPDHLVDCKAAIAWIREHADEWGIDPSFLCVTGGSAGGHLTAMVALTHDRRDLQPGFEDADTSVAAAVPFYGIYDWTNEDRDFGPEFHAWILEPLIMKAFYADEPEKFRDASPMQHIRADAPPMFVIHGDKDTLAPVAGARNFVAKLRAVSAEPVVYAEMKGAQHAFEIFPSPRAARVVEGVERFLTTIWTRRTEPTPQVEAELEQTLTD